MTKIGFTALFAALAAPVALAQADPHAGYRKAPPKADR
jgi:hypothetical protein